MIIGVYCWNKGLAAERAIKKSSRNEETETNEVIGANGKECRQKRKGRLEKWNMQF